MELATRKYNYSSSAWYCRSSPCCWKTKLPCRLLRLIYRIRHILNMTRYKG